MAQSDIDVFFRGPYSSKRGTLELVAPRDLMACSGLYLWAVEYRGGYLVNYVGKTHQSFDARFRQHRSWHESGKDVLDPEYLPAGQNWLVENPSPDITVRFFSFYRMFFAPLELERSLLPRIEQAIIHMFLVAGGKCRDFLGNKQLRPSVKPALKVRVASEALIHGMSDHVLI